MEWKGVEKRRFVRANFPCRIVILPPFQHVIETHTENIGAGGMRVVIEERLEIASLVGLTINFEAESIKCKGKVVWVVEKESSYRTGYVFFDTGIEFLEIKENDSRIINVFVERIVVGEK